MNSAVNFLISKLSSFTIKSFEAPPEDSAVCGIGELSATGFTDVATEAGVNDETVFSAGAMDEAPIFTSKLSSSSVTLIDCSWITFLS